MGKWILCFVASAMGHVLVFLISGFAVMLGVFAIWCFAALIFWDTVDSWPKTCGIPCCGKPHSGNMIVDRKIVVPLCLDHFKKLREASEFVKKGTSRPFFTIKRQLRMFYSSDSEKKVVGYLVERGVLEPVIIHDKPSYRPTEEFYNQVTKAKINLFFKGYILDMAGMTEEGTKIVIKNWIKEADRMDVETYAEIACTFVYWEDMDRELNPRIRPVQEFASRLIKRDRSL